MSEDAAITSAILLQRSRECSICQRLRNGDPLVIEVHDKVRSNQLSQSEAAQRLNTKLPTFNRHWKYHIKGDTREAMTPYTQEVAKEISEEILDKVKILRENLTKLNEKFETLITFPTYDRDQIASIKLLASEIRLYIETLAKLEGEISTAPIIQFNKISMEFKQLQQTILTSLCENCQKKLMTILEA